MEGERESDTAYEGGNAECGKERRQPWRRRRREISSHAPYVTMPVQDEACNVAGPWAANVHR